MTTAKSSNEQKDNIGIMCNDITKASTPGACGRSITEYKGRPSLDLPKNTSLPDELNAFYACFDNNNIVQGVRVATDPEDWVISLTEADVSKVFNQVNIRKVAGPLICIPPQQIHRRSQQFHRSPSTVERVESFKFLCVQITKWSTHTSQLCGRHNSASSPSGG